VSGIPTHVLGPAMNKNVGFDPMRDFTHIAYFGGTPNVLVAHPSLGVTTYRDFLAFARDGDGIGYVSAGFGTMGNWIAEFLAAKEKIGRAAAQEVPIDLALSPLALPPPRFVSTLCPQEAPPRKFAHRWGISAPAAPQPGPKASCGAIGGRRATTPRAHRAD
jgi:hypothetical protein